ncbi:hypothetical protein BJX99DRAFT_224653 [Aspergillus californicus]
MPFFGPRHSYNSEKDIPNLSDKTILVTGGNNGLGKETIKQLAKHSPAKLYMGARSPKKAQDAIAEIKSAVPSAEIHILEIDLASFSSIKAAATKFLAENDHLDVLVNNAGVFASPPGLTEDGYEIQFGTNYMGSALLTRLLLPILEATAKTPGPSPGTYRDVRIVNISSEIYRFAPKGGVLLDRVKSPLTELSTVARYGQSKLANIYFTQSYASRYPHIKSVALHPSLVKTDIGTEMSANPILGFIFGLFTKVAGVDIPTGALNQLWASTADSKDVKSGAYYVPFFKEVKQTGVLGDEKLAEELWLWTEKEFAEAGFK